MKRKTKQERIEIRQRQLENICVFGYLNKCEKARDYQTTLCKHYEYLECDIYNKLMGDLK